MPEFESLNLILTILAGLFTGTGFAVYFLFSGINRSNNMGQENGTPRDFNTDIHIMSARDGLRSAPLAGPLSKKKN